MHSDGTISTLPALIPEGKSGHSQSGLVLCGGIPTDTSCMTLKDGDWITSHTLQHKRWGHVSWQTDRGILLLGGHEDNAKMTTEFLSTTSSSSTEQFSLSYDTTHSCGIAVPNSDRLVISGGYSDTLGNAMALVQEYSHHGATQQLPSLNQPRWGHACTHFYQDNNLVCTFYFIFFFWWVHLQMFRFLWLLED